MHRITDQSINRSVDKQQEVLVFNSLHTFRVMLTIQTPSTLPITFLRVIMTITRHGLSQQLKMVNMVQRIGRVLPVISGRSTLTRAPVVAGGTLAEFHTQCRSSPGQTGGSPFGLPTTGHFHGQMTDLQVTGHGVGVAADQKVLEILQGDHQEIPRHGKLWGLAVVPVRLVEVDLVDGAVRAGPVGVVVRLVVENDAAVPLKRESKKCVF